MSTRSAAVTDPAIAAFVEQIAAGTNVAADSVAGLILRLVTRVGRLEKTVSEQGSKLDKLAQKPKPAHAQSSVRARRPAPMDHGVVKTGIDVATGAPVRLETKASRPRGRPTGRRDATPRARRWHRKPDGRAVHRREDIEDLGSLAVADVPTLDPEWDR